MFGSTGGKHRESGFFFFTKKLFLFLFLPPLRPPFQNSGAPPPKAGCNVAANGTVPFESNDEYACLCMKDQIQGIDLPKGKPCSKACGKSITGRPGRAVSGNADGKSPGFACVSLPIELGELNRFGHVHEADDKWYDCLFLSLENMTSGQEQEKKTLTLFF